uniref:Uncharacterized protein n=1 Tax=Anguilla anguilla TaxID=7936 RepID=A0A0E9UTM2_ANGAN
MHAGMGSSTPRDSALDKWVYVMDGWVDFALVSIFGFILTQ